MTPNFKLSNQERIQVIKDRMQELGISQRELAKAVGQDETNLSHIMSGRVNMSRPMFAAMWYYLKQKATHKALSDFYLLIYEGQIRVYSEEGINVQSYYSEIEKVLK